MEMQVNPNLLSKCHTPSHTVSEHVDRLPAGPTAVEHLRSTCAAAVQQFITGRKMETLVLFSALILNKNLSFQGPEVVY